MYGTPNWPPSRCLTGFGVGQSYWYNYPPVRVYCIIFSKTTSGFENSKHPKHQFNVKIAIHVLFGLIDYIFSTFTIQFKSIYLRSRDNGLFLLSSRLSFFFLFYKHQKLVLVEISLLLPICVWKAVYNIMFPSKQLSTLPKASSNHFNLIDWYKGSLHLATMKIIFCVLLFCTLVCGKKELQFSNICK